MKRGTVYALHRNKDHGSHHPRNGGCAQRKMARALEAIPGKSEDWLMCEFTDNCRLWFAGKNDAPAAFVQVKIFGKAHKEAYDRMTGAVCGVLGEELGIPADRIYITYSEYTDWGWNGSNF